MQRHLFLAIMFLISLTASGNSAEPRDLATGKVPDEALQKMAPENGFITDAATFEKLWKAWRPEEKTPKVDFEQDFVIVGTVDGPNLVILRPALEEDGNVKYVAAGTRMAGPGFGYRLVKMSREGVKTINGHPIKSDQVTGAVTVPDIVKSFNDRVLEIKLFEFDPTVADKKADLVAHFEKKNFSHEMGHETVVPFSLGGERIPKPGLQYYITVFVLDGEQRTHIGEIDGKRELGRVLLSAQPSTVKVVLREVE